MMHVESNRNLKGKQERGGEEGDEWIGRRFWSFVKTKGLLIPFPTPIPLLPSPQPVHHHHHPSAIILLPSSPLMSYPRSAY